MDIPGIEEEVIASNEHNNQQAQRKAEAKAERIEEALRRLGIDESRVVYMGVEGETKHYCYERPDIYQDFLERYTRHFKRDVWVVRDAGTAYINPDTGLSVITEFGCTEAVLPPLVHHFFSVNDNSLHAVAKARWRAQKYDGDDVESTLQLLWYLDQVSGVNICDWFTRNFARIVTRRDPEALVVAMEALLFQPSDCYRDYHESCLEFYYENWPEALVEAEGKPPKPATPGKINVPKRR